MQTQSNNPGINSDADNNSQAENATEQMNGPVGREDNARSAQPTVVNSQDQDQPLNQQDDTDTDTLLGSDALGGGMGDENDDEMDEDFDLDDDDADLEDDDADDTEGDTPNMGAL